MQSSIRSLISAGHSSGTCTGRANGVDEECLHLGWQWPYKLPARLERSQPPLGAELVALRDRPGQPAADTRIVQSAELLRQQSKAQNASQHLVEISTRMLTLRGRSWPLRGTSLQARRAQSALRSLDMLSNAGRQVSMHSSSSRLLS